MKFAKLRRGQGLAGQEPASPESIQRQREAHWKAFGMLETYAGRLLLVTHPGIPELYDGQYEGITQALAQAMPEQTCYRFSVHQSGRRKRHPTSQETDIEAGAQEIAGQLAAIVGAEFVNRNINSHLSADNLNVTALAKAAELTLGRSGPASLAHVAVVSSLGIDTVNLDRNNAHSGDTFALTGMAAGQLLQWDKAYQSQISGSGPHQID